MKHILILTALLVTMVAKAQLPADFRSEQIYLNPEKTTVLPGDTLGLEGMVTCLAPDRMLPYSNYVYVECYDERDSVLVRQKLRCKDQGYFNTRIATDYLWPAGVYYLRAYTQLMRNFSQESFAVQPFLLAKEFPDKEKQVYEARCTFVPSGGKLVAGQMQTVAALLTDEASFPVSADLLLMDAQGDTIAPVHTSASGMARLQFIPKAGVEYRLTGRIDGEDYSFPLPAATSDVKVQGVLNRQRLNYQLLNAGADLSRYRLFTYDRLNGIMELPSLRAGGIIQLGNAPAVLTLFLTDTLKNVISEYTVASRYEGAATLSAPGTLGIGKELSYELPALPEGSRVMVRVRAENDLLSNHAESALHYFSDYESALPFPRHLYAATDDERNNDLQTWLSTARFKRFNVKEALEKDSAIYAYLPEQIQTFSGWIEKKSLRPMSNGSLVAYHTLTDFVYEANLDEQGRFLIAVDDYLEDETFFIQAITPKGKPDFANYHVDDETFPALENKYRFRLPGSRYVASEVTIGNDTNLEFTVGKDKVRNYTLPDVTVKAQLRTEAPKQTHEFYSTNYADREEIDERAYGTLADILKDMPGIRVGQVLEAAEEEDNPFRQDNRGNGFAGKRQVMKWKISSTRGSSVLLGGNDGLPILVDNVRFTEADYDHLLYMPAQEIESVQLLRAWQTLAYTFGAMNGAILVKTRNYKEREDLPTKGAFYSPTGISKLSNTFEPQPWKADKPGRYRLLVDVFTDTGVQSYEHPFEVVEP